MSESQFCAECPTDMPKQRETGRWVEAEGHEHRFPLLRPSVYLSDSTPGAPLYHASIAVWCENGWLQAEEFPTMDEAMTYAAKVLAPLAQSRYDSQETR